MRQLSALLENMRYQHVTKLTHSMNEYYIIENMACYKNKNKLIDKYIFKCMVVYTHGVYVY